MIEQFHSLPPFAIQTCIILVVKFNLLNPKAHTNQMLKLKKLQAKHSPNGNSYYNTNTCNSQQTVNSDK